MDNDNHTTFVCYSWIPLDLSSDILCELLKLLPTPVHQASLRYFRIADRFRFVFGRLLLQHLLQENLHCASSNMLEKIEQTDYGRPVLPGEIDFNISHSGRLVVCAAGAGKKVGIDIELIQPVPLHEFESVLTSRQVQMIRQSNDPLKTFYRIWTMKESVLKAIGTGLYTNPERIDSDFLTFTFGITTYYLKELFIHPDYPGFLTTNREYDRVMIEEIVF